MTKDELKSVFGVFQNLNLAVLIEDLRRGLVCRRNWVCELLDVGGKILCPIAHGWSRNVCKTNPINAAGIDPVSGSAFVGWWDRALTIRPTDRIPTYRLHDALVELWQERMADADAVQGVIDEASAEEVVPYQVPVELGGES